MQLIIAAAQHVRGARLGALPHTLVGVKRSDDVYRLSRSRSESSTTVCSCQRPSWTPCERAFCSEEFRGLTMGCPECVVRCRTARDLDLLIPSRAPGSAPGTMTCSRERRGRLFYGYGFPSTQSSRHAVGSSGALSATHCEIAPQVARLASGRREGGLRGVGSVLGGEDCGMVRYGERRFCTDWQMQMHRRVCCARSR